MRQTLDQVLNELHEQLSQAGDLSSEERNRLRRPKRFAIRWMTAISVPGIMAQAAAGHSTL